MAPLVRVAVKCLQPPSPTLADERALWEWADPRLLLDQHGKTDKPTKECKSAAVWKLRCSRRTIGELGWVQPT